MAARRALGFPGAGRGYLNPQIVHGLVDRPAHVRSRPPQRAGNCQAGQEQADHLFHVGGSFSAGINCRLFLGNRSLISSDFAR